MMDGIFKGLVLLGALVLTGCGDRGESRQESPRKHLTAPEDALSKQVEALTGAPTKVLWAQHLGTDNTDAYSTGSNHQLMGLDTRDGLGAHVLLKAKGNYSRPLISPDGSKVIYTQKKYKLDSKKRKHYSVKIMATDWDGSEPKELNNGYAVAVWNDPATKIDWVYAARDIVPSSRIAWAARELVRFPLNAPDKVEPMWNRTQISPDNIQFSRDGHRASGQFAWPNGGHFIWKADESEFLRTMTGCWAAMAPDNSYVSWMLDGNHRQANLYAPGSPPKTWHLDFSKIEGLSKGEIYHPRWTNHPRFIALTGPYLGERSKTGSGFIGKGGKTAEVIIAKIRPDLQGFEGSVKLTTNTFGDSYPDVWIESGPTAQLESFAQGSTQDLDAERWPKDSKGLVFAWEDRERVAAIKLPDHRLLDCSVEEVGAARYGRALDMLLDAGSFTPQEDAQAMIIAAMNKDVWTVEFFLRARVIGEAAQGSGPVLSAPGVTVSIADGALKVNDVVVAAAPFALPAHISLAAAGGKISATVNGGAAVEVPVSKAGEGRGMTLGGGNLDLGLTGLAVFNRALSAGETKTHQDLWLARHAALPDPGRVRIMATLEEESAMPTEEGIDPYTRALVTYVYKVDSVIEGKLAEKRITVKHWAMMDLKPCQTFPRKVGQSYELMLEPDEMHKELEGQRAVDDTTAFDLTVWYDVAKPEL